LVVVHQDFARLLYADSAGVWVKMEAYANDACRTVAAQVSEAVGFQAMTQSTADTLAEVLARYIEEVSFC